MATLKGLNLKDSIRYPLYDTAKLSSGSVSAGTVRTFFTEIADGNTKTELDTNLTVSGQIPYSTVIVSGIRVNVFNRDEVLPLEDVNAVMTNSILVYQKEDKEIFKMPLMWIPAGAGLSGATSTTNTSTNRDIISNGVPVVSNYMPIVPEIYKAGDRIQITMIVKNAITLTKDAYVCVMLESKVWRKL